MYYIKCNFLIKILWMFVGIIWSFHNRITRRRTNTCLIVCLYESFQFSWETNVILTAIVVLSLPSITLSTSITTLYQFYPPPKAPSSTQNPILSHHHPSQAPLCTAIDCCHSFFSISFESSLSLGLKPPSLDAGIIFFRSLVLWALLVPCRSPMKTNLMIWCIGCCLWK